MNSPTIAAARALSDLVDTGRGLAQQAHALDLHVTGRYVESAIDTLDRARTILVDEGDSYIDAAWAFVDAGRVALARATAKLTREALARAGS